MKISGPQVAAARELLRLTQAELAEAAGIGWQTIQRFETGIGELRPSSLQKITAELERRGIEFTNGTGTGVRLDHAKAAAYVRTASPAPKESAH